jgi:hypothetical protein
VSFFPITFDTTTGQITRVLPDEAKMLDLVDGWHTGENHGKPLHEFLGMTWDEYAKCVTGSWREEIIGMDGTSPIYRAPA